MKKLPQSSDGCVDMLDTGYAIHSLYTSQLKEVTLAIYKQSMWEIPIN